MLRLIRDHAASLYSPPSRRRRGTGYVSYHYSPGPWSRYALLGKLPSG